MARAFNSGMRFPKVVFSSLLLVVSISSCAPKFNAAERSQLSTVMVAAPKIEADAYEDPYGGDVKARDTAATAPYNAGALGPLVGLAVGSAIAGTQNSMFEGEHSGHFGSVKKNVPSDFPSLLQEELKSAVAKDQLLGSRLRSQSDNKIFSTITSHRLVRVGKNDDGELLLTPEIFAEIKLVNASGKKMAGGSYRAFGTETHTVKEYAASATKARSAYKSGFHALGLQFANQLASKTRP